MNKNKFNDFLRKAAQYQIGMNADKMVSLRSEQH